MVVQAIVAAGRRPANRVATSPALPELRLGCKASIAWAPSQYLISVKHVLKLNRESGKAN